MITKRLLFIAAFLTLLSCSATKKITETNAIEKREVKAAMIKALEWQEAHPIFAIHPTDWTNGAYYTGVARAHRTTKNMMYMAALKNQAVKNDWNTFKRLYHLSIYLVHTNEHLKTSL